MNTFPLKEHLGSVDDAARFQRTQLICIFLIYGHFIIALAGVVPLWTTILSFPVLLVRWLFALHELFHLRNAEQVDPITRLLPLMLTPFSLGYDEFQDIHYRHHASMATPEDPEYYQIRGSKISGFLNAMTAPEQAFFRWIKYQSQKSNNRAKDSRFLVGVAIRFVLFVSLIAATGLNFLWYWIPLRASYAASYFTFFYLLHRRGSEYGVYSVDLPPWTKKLYALLYGQDAMLGTFYHDVHHDYPRASARALPFGSNKK